MDNSERLMKDVLPRPCVLYQSKVSEFDPEHSQVTLDSGDVVTIITFNYYTFCIHYTNHIQHSTCKSGADPENFVSGGGVQKFKFVFATVVIFYREERGPYQYSKRDNLAPCLLLTFISYSCLS